MPETKTLELITRNDLRSLLEHDPELAISIYMPTKRVAVQAEENSIALKDLLRRGEEELSATGLRRPRIEELMAPFRELLRDDHFWRHQAQGLALFRYDGFFRYYRLPFDVDADVAIDERLHIAPLLPALTGESFFYVLALSQKNVRFYRATRWGIDEIDLSDTGIPRSLDEALKYDDIEKSDMQFQPPARRRGAPGNREMFHSHGPGDEDLKKDIARFFNGVDAGIYELIGAEQAPLVLAGVEFLHPIYKQASKYRFIHDRGVVGNPDGWSADELHRKAWPLVEPHFHAALEAAKDAYRNSEGTGLTSCDLPDILVSLASNRVGTLFLRRGDKAWGRFDPAGGDPEIHPERREGDQELVEMAAARALLTGASVHFLDPAEMPCDDPVAAVYRF